ncbi:hypothetical protein [Actinopolymorpha pittospori]|uniref:ParB-like nuclease domain-containing protein n=1 Tax=Actinopolymorpha pittospori TaxID=648752 RepID=A0A927MYL0_9ACTN|nr:hypothetical protein [Actinopolymorpha pittospori]MBE1609336.1 hypothetical protein [Actinopolymorpha pittospori]
MPAGRRPFPLAHLVPPLLRDVILDFHWDHEQLWKLDLTPTEIPVAELAWHLELPLWTHGGHPFVVSPAEVAADPDRFRAQYARTLAADLSHPLHLLDRRDRLTILDGTHRLLKARLLGYETLRAVKVPMERLDDIAVR